GDFDLDGDVDVSDLGILAGNYGNTSGTLMVFEGDADFDGNVDVSDLGILAGHYGTNVGLSASSAVVPEPATMAMLVLGALALLIRRRRN
ncbi:MAG: PEP-CTERM sorting domain-containing protein, partial [Pirellulales bacterium]|nr:PEP-CTERM sorting domain-containing protein [Pirellulales bacterium]